MSALETRVMAQWMTESTSDDVRYRLRHALHSAEVQEEYDLILLDCPPRLTTACINALACCDYVLIPALLDNLSAEAVPRLLRWLRILKTDCEICPNLAILGILGNRCRDRRGPSTKQQTVWQMLHEKCSLAWNEDVYLFETMIPDSNSFVDAAQQKDFVARKELRSLFLDLQLEMTKRIPTYESQRTSTLSQ